jgi:hypothetical protein
MSWAVAIHQIQPNLSVEVSTALIVSRDLKKVMAMVTPLSKQRK